MRTKNQYLEKIEAHRKKMNEASKDNALTSREVVTLSKELDQLMNQYLKTKNKSNLPTCG
ncbi:Spo0E family sporulation regulatory protein-aspartic acid phosphatase [Thalassobacillus hwangdonensis]|uniref:Spo0E family sporulation regulatory protein-aspartic acid phosphatase n=1 Tax=Thalassobacillus hwangdonensis TaxID=546108 RepID=A0ABW3KZ09_9BACI